MRTVRQTHKVPCTHSAKIHTLEFLTEIRKDTRSLIFWGSTIMPSRLEAHSCAVGCGGTSALAAEQIGLLLSPMQRGAGNENPDATSGDVSCLLWWRRIVTNRLSVIKQIANDSKESGAVLAEILTNFFSALVTQAASQVSYLLRSTQTVKRVAIFIHAKTLSCYCAFISKTHISFSDWLHVWYMLIAQRAHWCISALRGLEF